MGSRSSLGDLLAVLLDGIAFYEQAAEQVRDPRLVDFFLRMGYLKKAVAADLAAELERLGEAESGAEALRQSLRQSYAEVLAGLGEAAARRYVEQLEQHEDRLLVVFRDATAEDAPDHVRELARVYFPMVDRMHREMQRLKAASEG